MLLPEPSTPMRKVVVEVPVGTELVVIVVHAFLAAVGTGVYAVKVVPLVLVLINTLLFGLAQSPETSGRPSNWMKTPP